MNDFNSSRRRFSQALGSAGVLASAGLAGCVSSGPEAGAATSAGKKLGRVLVVGAAMAVRPPQSTSSCGAATASM